MGCSTRTTRGQMRPAENQQDAGGKAIGASCSIHVAAFVAPSQLLAATWQDAGRRKVVKTGILVDFSRLSVEPLSYQLTACRIGFYKLYALECTMAALEPIGRSTSFDPPERLWITTALLPRYHVVGRETTRSASC